MKKEAGHYHKTYLTKPDYNFGFTSLGFRVPTVLVSPWIEKGLVDSTLYSHTSVLRYMEELLGIQPLTARDRGAASFAAQLSREQPRDNCPTSVPAPELPQEDPELYMKEPPGPKQDEWARRYTTKLEGHPDTGKRTSRELPTNEALSRYIKQRNQRDTWARSDDWKEARFELYTDSNDRWRWRRREGSGDIIAASTDAYDDRSSAELALERARFLAYILGDPVDGRGETT